MGRVKGASPAQPYPVLGGMHSAICSGMEQIFIPKKFEIQFRRSSDDQYTGALIIDGMEMGVGTPKTLSEIAEFLMPQRPFLAPHLGNAFSSEAA